MTTKLTTIDSSDLSNVTGGLITGWRPSPELMQQVGQFGARVGQAVGQGARAAWNAVQDSASVRNPVPTLPQSK